MGIIRPLHASKEPGSVMIMRASDNLRQDWSEW